MKIAVFGGTGRAGRLVVEHALAAGHEVVALARVPEKLAIHSPRLTVVQGDIRSAGDVERAIAGTDAVISVLGPSSNKPEFAVSTGARHILAAMEKHGVRRLVLSTGAGVRDPQDQPNLVHKGIGVLVKLLSRNVYEDMRRTVEIVRASDVDWTIVRVPVLNDTPATGHVRVGYVGKGTGARLSRADMAAFMVRQVEDRAYLRQAPAISN